MLALLLMHIFGKTTDERFIGLYFTVHLQHRARFHRDPNPMIHEPSRFLGNAEIAGHLVRANAVLTIGNHPNSGEPLVQAERTVLEDCSDLGRKLPLGMFFFAFPYTAGADEPNV